MKASTLDAICTMKMYYNQGKNTECHEVRYKKRNKESEEGNIEL